MEDKILIVGHKGLLGQALKKEIYKRKGFVILLENSPNNFLSTNSLPEDSYPVVNYSFPITKKNDLADLIKNQFGKIDIFINLAWKGANSLQDGSLEIQMRNLSLCEYLITLCNDLGCSRYLDIGSMEEIILERKLSHNGIFSYNDYDAKNNWYPMVKNCVRDITSFRAYQYKIEYLHTRLSLVIDKELKTEKYIEKTFKSILLKQKWNEPSNGELFNLSSTEEIARQIYYVALNGENNTDYVLGTSKANNLKSYFQFLERELDSRQNNNLPTNQNGIFLDKNDFNNDFVFQKLGYSYEETPEKLLKEILLK